MAASDRATSRAIVERLLALEGDPREGEPRSGKALRRVCRSVTDNLRESLGADGCDALIDRALARTQAEHPVLKEFPRGKGASVDLNDAVAGDEIHTPAVRAAVEALLTTIVEVLARLIGEDMATRIMYSDAPDQSDAQGDSR